MVGAEVEQHLIDPEGEATALVQRDRRLHAHQLALRQVVRRIEAGVAPRGQREAGRAARVVTLLVDQHDLGEHEANILAGDGGVAAGNDPKVRAELAGLPLAAEVKGERAEQQLQPEAHAGVVGGQRRRLLDGAKGIEERVQVGQRQGWVGDGGLDRGGAIARDRQPKVERDVLPLEHRAARVTVLARWRRPGCAGERDPPGVDHTRLIEDGAQFVNAQHRKVSVDIIGKGEPGEELRREQLIKPKPGSGHDALPSKQANKRLPDVIGEGPRPVPETPPNFIRGGHRPRAVIGTTFVDYGLLVTIAWTVALDCRGRKRHEKDAENSERKEDGRPGGLHK